jgi:hypothetical protein
MPPAKRNAPKKSAISGLDEFTCEWHCSCPNALAQVAVFPRYSAPAHEHRSTVE